MANYLYVALAGEDKLLIFDQDPVQGRLMNRREVVTPGGPGPLAVDPRQRFLYAGLRGSRQIATFHIDAGSGGLEPIGSVSLDADPCYLATDGSGRYLLAAYYGAGQATVHAIGVDGAVAQQTSANPTAEHAHCIQTDRSNRFAFVPHTLAPNVIFQFRFDEKTGALSPNTPPTVSGEAGAGPRHYVFHPMQDWVYVSNENGSSVTAYRFDPDRGTLSAFQTLSTLPAAWEGKNTCAQIHVHPSGRYLYVSNRGHDSIACFAVDEDTGELTELGQRSTEPVPRVFGLDPGGKFLYVAGQASGRLAAYRIDPETGLLDPHQVYAAGERPMWVKVLSF